MATANGATAEEIKRVPLFLFGSQESLDSPIDRRSDYYRQAARHVAVQKKHEPQPLLTPPNILTFLRILLVPVFVVLYFMKARLAPIITAVVFIAAAITDWLDGYLARKLKITSTFGAFLDPVADKIMVSTALILLAALPPAPLRHIDLAVPVMLIIGREITMSSLREWAAAAGGAAHKAVKVNSLGKWKTALQMVGMSAMLVFREADNILGDHPMWLDVIHYGTQLSLAILWVGAILAIWSLSNYFSNVWPHFRYPHGPPPPEVAMPFEKSFKGQ